MHKTVRNTRIMSSRPHQWPGMARLARPVASDTMGRMEPAAESPVPTRSSLVSARLILRPVPWDAVRAITAGHRLGDWADDYPSDGDVVIAGLLQEADQAVGLEAGQPVTGQVAAGPGDEAWGHRQVVERASGLVVGGIGFFGPPHVGEVEIGYGIVPSRQGRGYATEALRAMIAMAWADSRVRTVAAGTDAGNAASQRVLAKAGFRQISAAGEFRYRLTRTD
jgi:ribosomal-protein-alanine N-acetyltransferase